jgi:hypothetical protein
MKTMAQTNIDQFFNDEITAIAVDSRARASRAARQLAEDVQRQIRRNFTNPSAAFSRGVKVDEFDNGSYVRLSPILSVHAEPTRLKGNPNLWILLPDGARLGFKRIGKGFNWNELKRRYGTRLSFVSVDDGHVVLYRNNGVVSPIYKIQSSVTTKQRIEFYERAEEIAEREGFDYEREGREVKLRIRENY